VVPKKRAKRKAVSAVMPRFSKTISLIRRGGMRRATVRATSAGPVEVMALDRKAFDDLMRESEPARRELERIIDERLAG